MRPQTGPWADRQPAALGGRSIGRFVAVDEPKARLAIVRGDVEAYPATVRQLRMAPGAHQLADIGIVPAFDQQLRYTALEYLDVRCISLLAFDRLRDAGRRRF